MNQIIALKEDLLQRGLADATPRVRAIIMQSQRFEDCVMPVFCFGTDMGEIQRPEFEAECVEEPIFSTPDDEPFEDALRYPDEKKTRPDEIEPAQPLASETQTVGPDLAFLIVGAFWNSRRMRLIIDGRQRAELRDRMGASLLQQSRDYAEMAPNETEAETDRAPSISQLTSDGKMCFEAYRASRDGTSQNAPMSAQCAVVEHVLTLLKVEPDEIY